MVNLDTNGKIQLYSANTKINLVQEAEVDGTRYFRTETAAIQGLNWAFKASDFGLPDKVASLEPSKESFVDNESSSHLTHSKTPSNKKVAKIPKSSESEEKISEERKVSLLSAFKRFLRRNK